MKDHLLFEQGQRNLTDASFIKRHSIPLALKHKRWNIVVYEAQRVTELLLKGIICLTGHSPLHTHHIHKLVDQLNSILPSLSETSLVFITYTPEGEGYGVRIYDDKICIFRRDNNVETQLGPSIPADSFLSADKLLSFELVVFNTKITLACEGEEIATRRDSTYEGKPEIRQGFTRQPNKLRIARLKQAGEQLKRSREAAFYGEAAFSEEDTRRAISLMEDAFLAASCFFIEESESQNKHS
jgi:hypothetical protein